VLPLERRERPRDALLLVRGEPAPEGPRHAFGRRGGGGMSYRRWFSLLRGRVRGAPVKIGRKPGSGARGGPATGSGRAPGPLSPPSPSIDLRAAAAGPGGSSASAAARLRRGDARAGPSGLLQALGPERPERRARRPVFSGERLVRCLRTPRVHNERVGPPAAGMRRAALLQLITRPFAP
jgi:hypothetical protein